MATPTMSTMTIIATSAASNAPLPTVSGGANGSGSMGQKTSNSPLLFFVALGFGVLFTNLWIIIGVKYCFRYQSARRRGVPMNSEGLALGHVHHGRRRREKKLMTIEDVQTQFPMVTYKTWRASRERAGLSTEGGVQAVGVEEAQVAREVLKGKASSVRALSIRSRRSIGSRPASTHSIEPVESSRSQVYEFGHFDENSSEKEASPTEKNYVAVKGSDSSVLNESHTQASSTTPHSSNTVPVRKSVELSPASQSPSHMQTNEEEDIQVDETQIQHLPDNLGSGDTCAICIEQLEDDDEVRGLTCGHAFHCACVDVWLTTRRAICPLCKQDYWVRKPAVPATAETTAERSNSDNPTTNAGSISRVVGRVSRLFPIRGRGGPDLEAQPESRSSRRQATA